MRNYRCDSDYRRIRDFLRDVFFKNNYWERSWHVNRFDYWRWHGIENMGHGRLETDVFIWETPDKNIAAVLNREGPGSVWLQIHPQYRTQELEEEMINVAAEHLTVPAGNGQQRHHIWVDPDDNLRLSILKRLGYTKSARVEYQRRRSMADSIIEVSVADGYTVRALGDEDELPSRSWASWRAFHPKEPDEAYQGWEWYHNIQRAPLYRRDLDIVATVPDGEVAAFSTVWFDKITGTGVFEPVGTVPEHQRRGLARAVMTEGLKRLKGLGAQFAYVGSWNDATHALYGDRLGFNDYIILNAWEKRMPVESGN
ncbi:MAG: GNAT family N-acetyltransferase [Candidatus Zixiibacteriota bacterium]|nr:MAG: GNAT family N-acetyltransferase [candidate division Zixibacteria bacterium]